ncbi:uncharacterized protein [Drosophila tropicalis]|uniref:uncharacterized protein isoform X2 n=1 Tax=Drosophila tropicalis TaxID=46794 RepID=UPI0035AB740A
MTDLNELMGSPFVRVKLVAFVHYFFITNAMLGNWGHGGYEFSNFLFMIALFWTMHSKDSIESVQTKLTSSREVTVFLGDMKLLIDMDISFSHFKKNTSNLE